MAASVQVAAVERGTLPGQLVVYVEWSGMRADNAYILVQNGKVGGDSGNIARRVQSAAKRAALTEWAAQQRAATCLYCGRVGPLLDDRGVPGVGDDDAWAELAGEHEPTCEWVATRAHRLEATA